MIRTAIYARYSSENQKESSIEDQVRICRERAERERWQVVNVYTDHAISGASMHRPGVLQLKQDINAGRIDIVLTEALDRLSRDQEDIAGLFKRAQFAGVKIITLSDGEITMLHVGLKGTMNALFLKDMKEKVKRGQRGRVENGKIGGGNCYGYDIVRRLDARGEVVRGERTINEAQARVIRRIYEDYAAGKSPKAIAQALNREGVPAPTAKGWGPTTVYGNWQRGAGILNNELYLGWIVWNKVSYPKNPDTGKFVARINPEAEWVRKEVPELRIIDPALWEKVKQRQLRRRQEEKTFWQCKRPRYLFSYLLKCGCCGGGMAKVSASHYACSTARNKGASLCRNLRTMRQDELEQTVIGILQSKLMDPKLVEVFCQEYTAHVNRLRMEQNASRAGYRAELEKLVRRERRIVQAVLDGYANEALKQESWVVENRKRELEAFLKDGQDAPVLLHPNMAARYRKEIGNLLAALNNDTHREEALESVRALIDKVVLTPDETGRGMTVNLYGDLAGILKVATGSDVMPDREPDLREIKLVVGLDDRRSTPRRVQDKVVGPAGLEPATRPL